MRIRNILLTGGLAVKSASLFAVEEKRDEAALQKTEVEEKQPDPDNSDKRTVFAKALLDDIGLLKLPFMLSKINGFTDDIKEMEGKMDEARLKLHALIAEKPEPSPELDLLFSRYLNNKIKQSKILLQMLISLREDVKPQTLKLLLDKRGEKTKLKKALEDDRKSRIEALAPDSATAEQKAKVAAIRKADEPLLDSAKKEVSDAMEMINKGLLTETIAPDTEARIKSLQDKMKALVTKEYAQIFQIRRIYSAEQMKDYFKKSEELQAAIRKEAEERSAKAKDKAKI
jgi:hypothetical protein